MPIYPLQNGESFGLNRGIIEANFSYLDSNMIIASQVLTRTNVSVFVPTLDYHPCTKLYSDELKIAWDTVFNPQEIEADVFLRSNHTGNLSPSVITQDSLNRFVTDTQTTSWDGKEPAIGAKETGFNLPVGTTANTVAAGDHVHTKTDIGLGNVDNTSDTSKPVSTAQQTALDLKANSIDFDEVDNTSDTSKPVSTAQQTALDLKLNIAAVPISRASVYLDVSEAESTRTTTTGEIGVRSQIEGIFVEHNLVDFTFSGNILTYTGPDGCLDYIMSVVQKSSTINLTIHAALQHKPVEDAEEDPWIERPMSRVGTYLSTALEAKGQSPSLDDFCPVSTGDRFKLVAWASKADVDIIMTHLAAKFVLYKIN